MKLCKDCKYSTPRYSNLVFCLHQNNILTSPMDGAPEIDRSASCLRDNKNKCGPEAAWFEPKEPA